MNIAMERASIVNGQRIPAIGLATWHTSDADAYAAVTSALEAGYRHIDTARANGNEAGVGRALADSGLPRDEVFITSKLPAHIDSYDGTMDSFEMTLSALGTASVDLYLLHAPRYAGVVAADRLERSSRVWRALEDILASGRARSIGVSGFTESDLESLAETARVLPSVNQIRFHIGHAPTKLVEFCHANAVAVSGYAPLATTPILATAAVRTIAGHYGRSAEQVAIRYVLQKDVIALPSATHPDRIRENFDLDFEITPADMAALDSAG